MKYDISVIVPVYNVSQYIERCLHSLFGQTYNNIEYIFVDDCTPDNSIEIIQEIKEQYPERKNHIKIIKHEKNRGLAAARNTGVLYAKGEYILHIDSDDYVEQDMVEEMYMSAKKENADIVVADFILQWKNALKYVSQNIDSDSKKYLIMVLEGNAMPAVWNKLFRKRLYTENNIEAVEGVNYGEDLSVTPRLIYRAKKIIKINKAFVHYVQYNSGAYTKKISEKVLKENAFVYHFLEEYFSNTAEADIDTLVNAINFGKLRKKAELLKVADSEYTPQILTHFSSEASNDNISQLNLFDRQLLRLAQQRNFFSLKILVRFYKMIFITVQRIKCRK